MLRFHLSDDCRPPRQNDRVDDGSGTLGQPVVVREESVGSDTVDISKANPPMQAVYRGIGAYVGGQRRGEECW